MGPSYYAFPDGRSLTMTGVDARKDYEALARFSRKDAEAYGEWRKWLGAGGDHGALVADDAAEDRPGIRLTSWIS